MKKEKLNVVIGAGPAGLGAAYELSKSGIKSLVFDRNESVGGLARTFNYDGFYFDIGPHRFWTKNKEINNLWREILGSDFKKVKRLTRIYYNKFFFNYPIRPFNVLRGLGVFQVFLIGFSYLIGKIRFSGKDPINFEEWMIKNFGRRLYNIFFKTYTEKVWGIPCYQLGPEWANQRIKNLNLWQAAKNVFTKDKSVKSLVEEFDYPTKGAGMLYKKIEEIIEARGTKVFLKTDIKKVFHENYKIIAVEILNGNKIEKVSLDYLFSSMPITSLIKMMDPQLPVGVLKAADKLFYRDHITVNLIINRSNIFPDQWIYIHDPNLKMARIANYTNFSSEIILSGKTPISVEYFVFAQDDLWQASDGDLMRLATDELKQLEFIQNNNDILGGFVVREKDSYPTYYTGHQKQFEILKKYLLQFSNLQLIGRAGMYKYNNQDHALLTGILAARNFMGEKNDIWAVNAEDEYLEVKKHEL